VDIQELNLLGYVTKHVQEIISPEGQWLIEVAKVILCKASKGVTKYFKDLKLPSKKASTQKLIKGIKT